jgi:YbbR domain-containing protein
MKIKLFENLTLKLVAFILAVVIWFLVVGEKKSEVRLTVPLELRNLSEQLEITQQSFGQVEVTVRGFSSVVKQLTPGDIDVHIDLSNVIEGKNTFALSPDEIPVPVGTKVIQVSPSQVDILLDATGSKTVPVKPITRGIPVEGYILGSITTEPKVVTITGARRVLNTITKVETEAVVVDNIDQDLVKKAKIKLPNGIRIEKEEEKIVSVNVTIVPKMVELFFEDVPLLVEGEERPFTLSPQAITALVHGPELELSNMAPADIPAFIETEQLPEGQSVVQPTFKLPESISVKRYYPKTITINITKSN